MEVPRYEFPGDDLHGPTVFNGEPLIERPGVSAYLTEADSIFVYETGDPSHDPSTGVVIDHEGPRQHSPVELEQLGLWFNDEEVERAAKKLDDLRRRRGE